MKLTVVVYDNYPDEHDGIKPYVECVIGGCSGDVDDIAVGSEEVQDDFSQAEQVARLSTVAAAIRKTIDNYYSQDANLLPKVVINQNSDNENN
ncbi:MAG: hypothetical protein NC226_09530 [Bacteroides cellulosilyticus]|nr:hypothetical protein [Bacteroides cellulosilyticus]